MKARSRIVHDIKKAKSKMLVLEYVEALFKRFFKICENHPLHSNIKIYS